MTMVAAGIIGGATALASVASGIIGMGAADKARREAARRAAALNAQIASIEKNRQAIINPYAGVKNVSGLAKDMSYLADKLSNPYANLGVATNAAKFEAEQIDLSLANTLDTLRETGASAGGATALAQAALKAKQGISATLEQQESQNDKLRAQGQADLQQQKMGIQLSEAQRMQGIQMSEEQRMQQAGVAGKEFMFQAQENRDIGQLNRLSSQLGGAQQQEMQASADYTGALTGMIGGVVSAGAQVGQAGVASKWGKV